MLALAFTAALASLSGRYDVTLGMDEVRDAQNACDFIRHGTMPRHSGVSGFMAVIPPGISFAYIPGLILSPHNPVAAEKIGAALMFLGTLLGIYLWINKRLGFWPTALSMLIFSAGSVGAFYATSLWPRAHPFFLVWMLYFLTLWIERKNGGYLATALVVYAAGLYWYLEMAPALLVVPVLFFLYRAPMRWRGIVLAGAISLAIWSPFLIYDAGDGFANLRALLTQKTRTDYPPKSSVLYAPGNHLVDASAARGKTAGKSVPVAAENVDKDKGDRWYATKEWGVVWFQANERRFLDEPGYVFYSGKLGCWAFQSATTGRLLLQGKTEWEPGLHEVAFPTDRKPAPGSTLLLKTKERALMSFAPLTGFDAGGRFPLFALHLLLFSGACVFLLFASGLSRRFLEAARFWRDTILRRGTTATKPPDDGSSVAASMVLLGTLVPAIVLLLILPSDALHAGERRFWWLWVGGALCLGCALGGACLRGRRILVPLGLLATVTLATNPGTQRLLRNAFAAWPGDYTGPDTQAIDALAASLEREGKTEAHIGYDINCYWWQTEARVIDGRSKNFAQWDIALLLRHGIRNLDDTAEGLSPADDYIVHGTDYGLADVSNAGSGMRWSMTLDGSLPEMETVATTPYYEIRRRRTPAK
jgi:hypothetical protein